MDNACELRVNSTSLTTAQIFSLIESLRKGGHDVSRFCHHDNLPVSGSCRACLIEVENLEKPTASCVAEFEPDLKVWTESIFAKKTKESTVEFLLRNHPLDCPVCDQGGECDLQDQSKTFGGVFTRFFYKKRSVIDKNCGFFIKTIMTRCIHCTRCVRFSALNEDTGFGLLHRGEHSEVGGYIKEVQGFELLGNVIDLCPVGALTARTYSFQSRPWELKIIEGLDLTDGLGSNVYINYKETEIFKISAKSNKFLNGTIINDKCRFSYDSLHKGRLKRAYQQDEDSLIYNAVNWHTIYQIPRMVVSSVNILINEELDLENILFLKYFSNQFSNNIKINLINKCNTINNLYFYKLTGCLNDLEKNSRIGILISSNPKMECSILNFRLKLKCKKKIFTLFCFGRFFDSNLQIKFLNINIKNVLFLWEGKLKKVSKIFTATNSPVFFIGESFYRKEINLNFLLLHLKKQFPTAILINIKPLCNEEGLTYLNIKSSFKFKHEKNSAIFCVNLQNSRFIQKHLLSSENTIFWLNHYRPEQDLNVDYFLPLCAPLENENSYMNFEQQIQKTQKIFSSMYESRSLKVILEALFLVPEERILFHHYPSYFKFFLELIKHKHLFYLLDAKINYKSCFFAKDKLMVTTYPLKTGMEKYYASNDSTKNSSLLRNAQRHLDTKRKNFFP